MFSGLNQKETNGGVNDNGQLTSDTWNGFVNELIRELQARIQSITFNGVNHTPDNGNVNLGNVQITTDSQLDSVSANPIQNRAVAAVVAALRKEIAEAGGAMTIGGLDNVADALDDAPSGDHVLYQANGDATVRRLDISSLLALLNPTTYAMKILNGLQTNVLSITVDDPLSIRFTVTSQVKDNTVAGSDFVDTGDTADVSIDVRNGSGEYVTRQTLSNVTTGVEQVIDVRQWLTTGANNIRLRATGVSYETQATFVYTVQVSSLTLDISLFQWQTPYNAAFRLPYLVGGNVEKTLHVTVTGDNYSHSYTANLGSRTNSVADYLDIEYPGATGVYTLEAWLTSNDGTITTAHQTRQFMCLDDGDTAKLLAVNNVAGELTNWTANDLLHYVLYDTSGTSSSVVFTLTRNGTTIFTSSQNAVNRSEQVLTVSLDEDISDSTFIVVLAIENTDETTLAESITFPVDNSVNYAATSGAILHINPKDRSNAEANRESIVNAVNGNLITAQWTGFAFSDNDGWATDDNGVKCLVVNSGQHVHINFSPFENNVAQGSGYVFYIRYKLANCSDYDAVAVDVSKQTALGHAGLQISPRRVFMATQQLYDIDNQALDTDDGDILDIAIVVLPAAYTFTAQSGSTYNMNLIRVYSRGRINKCFEYNATDQIECDTGIDIGCNGCTTYIYDIKCYDRRLSSSDNLQNYINGLLTIGEKAAEKAANDVYENNVISPSKVQALGINTFISDKPFPGKMVDAARGLGGDTDRRDVTLVLNIQNAVHNVTTIAPVRQRKQGTSSSFYLEFNQRYGTLTGTEVTYNENGEVVSVVTKKIQLWSFLPKISDMTFKKNWASSMQDHKAGSVNTYTDAWKLCGGTNPALDDDEKARITVYQEPFVGFFKNVDSEGHTSYICMGNFTGGPHKGDKPTFGYDLDVYPGLLSMEGCNNDPVLTNFKMPWDDRVIVDTSDDILVMYRTGFNVDDNNISVPQYTKAWEQDFGSVENGDSDSVAQEKLARFKEAYEMIYKYNPYIAPWEGTLSELQAAPATWLAQQQQGIITTQEYSTLITTEYWMAESGNGYSQYDLYNFDASTQSFVRSTVNGVPVNVGNLLN